MHVQHLTMSESITRLDGFHRRFVGRRLSDHPQIVGEHAPAHPAFPPGGAVRPAAVQLVAPFQPADAAFNAGPPVATTPEPPLLRMGKALGRLHSGLGNTTSLTP